MKGCLVDRDFADSENFVIGNDMGRFGAAYRLILAVYFIAIFILKPLVLDPQPLDEVWSFLGETAFWVVAIAGIYFAVFYALKDIVLARLNPWAGTAIFLGTPALLGLMGLIPTPVSVAFGVYVSLSLFLAIKMRYGGCEVVALPTYLLRRRFTMYCGLNMWDLMERALISGRKVQQSPVLSLVSITLMLFVVSYFSFVSDMFEKAGLDFEIAQKWVYLLVVPTLYLAWNAWQLYRIEGLHHKYTRWFGLGVVVLTFYMLVVDGLVPFTAMWNLLKLLGAAYSLYEGGKLIRAWRNRKAARNEAEKQREIAVEQLL